MEVTDTEFNAHSSIGINEKGINSLYHNPRLKAKNPVGFHLHLLHFYCEVYRELHFNTNLPIEFVTRMLEEYFVGH
jgi:hypothetical protein